MKSNMDQMLDEARAEGQSAILARLLRHRFKRVPRPFQARLADASVAELDTWADRVIEAPTLEAVFEGKGA